MKDKLEEMDQVVFDISQKMPQRSLLVVLGDHGMTDEGDHGRYFKNLIIIML